MQNNIVSLILADQIREPQSRMRLEIDSVGLDDLAQSIKTHGLINPITVKPVGDHFEIVAGNRRYLACLRAGVIHIPCVIREMTQDEADSIMAHENLVRQDVDPVEEAVYVGRLVGNDESKISEVARKVNRSEQWVRDRLEMLDYPDHFLTPLKNGQLKLGVAQWLARIKDEFWRKEYVNQAVSQGMSVIQARYLHDQHAMGIIASSSEVQAAMEAHQSSAPPLARAQCAVCQEIAIEPNLQMIWVHKECPSESAPPSEKSE